MKSGMAEYDIVIPALGLEESDRSLELSGQPGWLGVNVLQVP